MAYTGNESQDGPRGPVHISEPLRSILHQAVADRATDVHFDPIADGMHERALQERLRDSGTRSMIADALDKAARGVTSMEEIMPICLADRTE